MRPPLFLVVFALFTACKGEPGATGPQGPPGDFIDIPIQDPDVDPIDDHGDTLEEATRVVLSWDGIASVQGEIHDPDLDVDDGVGFNFHFTYNMNRW